MNILLCLTKTNIRIDKYVVVDLMYFNVLHNICGFYKFRKKKKDLYTTGWHCTRRILKSTVNRCGNFGILRLLRIVVMFRKVSCYALLSYCATIITIS